MSTELPNSLQDLGASGLWIPAAVGLVGGLILLLAGGKVLRPVAAMLGGAAGGMAGWVFLPSLLPTSVYGFSGASVGAGIGAVVGLVAALVLFRAAMAAAGAATFGAAGFLLAAMWISGVPQVELTKDDAASVVLVSSKAGLTQDDAHAAATAAGAIADHVWGQASAAWTSLPSESRLRILGCGLGAGLLGLMIGALMPRRAAALVTSLFGAGVFLVSLTCMVRAENLPGQSLLDHGPMGWLAIWFVVAVAGLVFQLCAQVKPTPAKKPQPQS